MLMPRVALLALALTLIASPALAAKKRGPGKPTPDRTAEVCKELEGDAAEACKVVGKYLDLGKQGKWAEAKKLIHPKTLEVIGQAKKNTGEERHGMAPWYWAKETYAVYDWALAKTEPGENGTIQVETKERHYRVEEDGISEEEEATYLAGKTGGAWFVADVRRGGGGFDKTSIRVGMKGYFDGAEEKKPAEKPEGDAAPAP